MIVPSISVHDGRHDELSSHLWSCARDGKAATFRIRHPLELWCAFVAAEPTRRSPQTREEVKTTVLRCGKAAAKIRYCHKLTLGDRFRFPPPAFFLEGEGRRRQVTCSSR